MQNDLIYIPITISKMTLSNNILIAAIFFTLNYNKERGTDTQLIFWKRLPRSSPIPGCVVQVARDFEKTQCTVTVYLGDRARSGYCTTGVDLGVRRMKKLTGNNFIFFLLYASIHIYIYILKFLISCNYNLVL